MKHILTIGVAVLILLGISSCRKEPSVSIVAKWSLVNDSVFLAGTSFFQGRSSNYSGVAADYFDFKANGNLYIKKGSDLDTAKYSVAPGNGVKIVYYSLNGTTFGSNGAIAGTYNIARLTQHMLILTLSGLTPEGEETEVINLKK